MLIYRVFIKIIMPAKNPIPVDIHIIMVLMLIPIVVLLNISYPKFKIIQYPCLLAQKDMVSDEKNNHHLPAMLRGKRPAVFG